MADVKKLKIQCKVEIIKKAKVIYLLCILNVHRDQSKLYEFY